MELKLFQRQVAEMLGTDEASVYNWEVNSSVPQIRFFPSIISFLGYDPFEVDTSTFAGKLKAYRYNNGLSFKELGKILNVEASATRAWESGENQPQKRILRKLEQILCTNLSFSNQRKKPYPVSYPDRPVTLGDHIRKKRMELKLFQHDVAKILNVRRDNICNWEVNYHVPDLVHFPRIIEFLGYFPFEIDTNSIGGRLKAYRFSKGITISQLGKILKVRRDTLSRWEKGVSAPPMLMLKKIERHITKNQDRLKGK